MWRAALLLGGSYVGGQEGILSLSLAVIKRLDQQRTRRAGLLYMGSTALYGCVRGREGLGLSLLLLLRLGLRGVLRATAAAAGGGGGGGGEGRGGCE